MAKVAQCFVDNSGAFHPTPEEAIVADIGVVLGRVGSDPGLANGIARKIIERRADIERAFAELDAMTCADAPALAAAP